MRSSERRSSFPLFSEPCGIKSNLYFVQEDTNEKFNDPIQCLGRRDKGLQRATYMYPKVHIDVKTHSTKIPVKTEQQT